MGEYGLGIDLGTTYTAAAIIAGGVVEAVRLGGRRAEIPSMIFRREDGEILIGEAARRRGESAPEQLVADVRAQPPDLVGRFLAEVVATACRGRAGKLGHVVLTHPMAWDDGDRDRLRAAAERAGLPAVTLVGEAVAAAAGARPGELVAVYDLGATFEATLLRRTETGADVLATETVDEVEFDHMLFDLLRTGLSDLREAGLQFDPREAGADLARLRRECAEAIESLSFDTETEIAVDLPGLHTRVPVRRSELEDLISPALVETVTALQQTFETASVRPEDADAVILAGGSARIPLVAELVSAALGRPVPPGEQPELAVAMGAARLSRPAADRAGPVAFPAIPLPTFPPVAPVPVSSAPVSSAPASPALASPAPASLAPVSPASPNSSVPPVSSVPPFTPAPSIYSVSRGSSAVPVSSVPVVSGVPVVSSGWAGWAGAFDVAGPTGARTASVRPAVDVGSPTRPVARRRPGRIWTYRWPIAVGVAGVLVAAAVTMAAARTRDSAPPPAAHAVTTAPVVLLWKTPIGSGATDSPAVSSDLIVFGMANGQVHGFRRDDGLLDWSVTVGAGARVATGITGGRAFASTAGGRVAALDTTTGQIAWQRSTSTEFDARPVVGAGRLYAGGRDGVLYAYDLAGRHTRWRVWADDPIGVSPALAGAVAVLAAEDGRLYATDRFGTPMWKPSVGEPAGSPVAAGDAVCLPVRNGSVRCARAADGALLPPIAPAGIPLTSVAGGAGLLFAAGADGSVGAWDPISGQQRWSYRPPSGTGGAGHLLTRTGEVDVAYPDGRVAGLDAGTGVERWQYQTGDHLDTAPSGDDHGIFVLGASGILYALRPPGVAAALGSAPTAEPPATTEPAFPPPHHRATPDGTASEPTTSPSGSPSGSTSAEPGSGPPPDGPGGGAGGTPIVGADRS